MSPKLGITGCPYLQYVRMTSVTYALVVGKYYFISLSFLQIANGHSTNLDHLFASPLHFSLCHATLRKESREMEITK